MKIKPKIKLIPKTFQGKKIICLHFNYNKDLIQAVKKIIGIKWNQQMKCWYIEQNEFKLSFIFNLLKKHAFIDYSSLKISQKNKTIKQSKNQSNLNLPKSYLDMLDQRRYSENTKSIYVSYFKDFIRYFENRNLEKINVSEINNYILGLIRKNNISTSQQNQRINAIKFYYEKVLGKEKMYMDIKRPKTKKLIPDVLSGREIKRMIDVTDNLKHKCIISLLYSAGLRRSELINLKLTDILSDQMLIKVEQSKGNKDRYVGLSHHMLNLLREYYKKYLPKYYVFEGKNGAKYSAESVLRVVKTAAEKAGIKRNVTPHMLRHSFATHHLENGTDLRHIQTFLGHRSSRTTEIYTHVAKTDFSKFTNPLDNIYTEDNGNGITYTQQNKTNKTTK